MSRGRTYSAGEKANAVALMHAVGPLVASQRLGIPRTTLQYWMHQPSSSVIVAQAEASIAERLRSVADLALAEVEAGLRNPRAKLGDKVAALRVISDQLALSEGRATENIAISASQRPAWEVLDDDELAEMRDFLDQIEGTDDALLVDALLSKINGREPSGVG